MKKLGLLLVLSASLTCFGQQQRTTIYIEPQQGFETYIAAAISKKNVPVDVVTDQTKADFSLKAAPVQIKSESTGGKVARCLFASCIGIEDKGNVSVQFIDTSSSKMLWAYSVNKQKGGSKNEQSMAEAIAKHLKDFVESKSGQEILAARASEPAATAPQPELSNVAFHQESNPSAQATEPALPSANVIVKSTPPGCDINVDGKYMGSTPSTIQLTPGEHLVSIEKENLTPWQRTMTVTAGGNSTIDATLAKP
jgi:hypothetical protein